MQEMNRDAIYFHSKLREFVEEGFLAAPIIPILPIGNKAFEKLRISAVFPANVFRRIRPAGLAETVFKIIQYSLWYIDFERFYSKHGVVFWDCALEVTAIIAILSTRMICFIYRVFVETKL